VKLEPIQDRVRQLLKDKKNMTQAELAEAAGVAPAALSRFMNGAELKAEHFFGIARALGVSIVALVAGTNMQEALLEWVPRERYEQAETERLAAVTALEAAQAEARGRLAEIAVLTASLASLRKEHGDLQNRETQLLAEIKRLLAHSTQLDQKLAACRTEYERAQLTIKAFNEQLTQARQQLAASKNDAMGSAAVGALLGGIVVAAMNSGSGSTRRRKT
jgi:transcriptional regulator with XRE-family HTH domain